MKKSVILGCLMIVLTIFLTLLVVKHYDKIAGLFESKTEEPMVVEPSTITITTYDVVAQRRMEMESIEVDKIYYSIPEPALIAIVDYLGTSTTRENVVSQYLREKKYYDGIIIGANDNKHYKPDSIPKSSTPTVPMQVITDSIRR